MIASPVISLARTFLQDVVTTYRWSDGDLLTHLNDTIRDAFSRRPDLRLSADGTLSAAFSDLALSGGALPSTVLPLDEDWREPLAHGVAGRAFQADSADTENRALAEWHLNRFYARL